MGSCTPPNILMRFIRIINKAIAIDTQEEATRIEVWNFNSLDVQQLLYKGVNSISDKVNSDHIKRKLHNFVKDLDLKLNSGPLDLKTDLP